MPDRKAPTMSDIDQGPALSAADQLMKETSGKRKAKREYDNLDIIDWIMRLARTVERRAIGDPGMLPYILLVAQRYEEAIDVAIAANAERFHLDPRLGASQAECGRAMGMSTQAAGKRKAKGIRIIEKRLQAAGVARLASKRATAAEIEREKKAVERATEYVVTHLADFRARKAA